MKLGIAEDVTGITSHGYKFVGRLGSGAFGQVYLVERLKDGVHQAAKVALAGWGSLGHKEHLMYNIQLGRHANIPKLHKYFIFEVEKIKHDVLVLDKYDIALADKCLKGTKCDHSCLNYVARELIETLRHIHTRGYVYIDLKPENIMFDSKGEVKLVDYGLLTRIHQSNGTRNIMGQAGTANYVSQRAAAGKPLSALYDLESLGFVLAHLSEPNNLPWIKSPAKSADEMTAKKKAVKDLTILAGDYQELANYFKLLSGHKFDSTIDYAKLANVFK